MGYWKDVHTRAVREARSTLRIETGAQMALLIVFTILTISLIWSFGGSGNAWDETVTKISATLATFLIFPLLYLVKFISVPNHLRTEMLRQHEVSIKSLNSRIQGLEDEITARPDCKLYLVRTHWGWCVEVNALNTNAVYFAHLDFARNTKSISLIVPMPAIWPMHTMSNEYEIIEGSRDLVLIYAINKDFQNNSMNGDIMYCDDTYHVGRTVSRWKEDNESTLEGEEVVIEIVIISKPKMKLGSKKLTIKVYGPRAEIISGDIELYENKKHGAPIGYHLISARMKDSIFDNQ